MQTFIKSVKTYNADSFRADFLAGLTVAVMLIPQGMAYALLTGVPAIYGLYTALIPMLIYPLFGTSRHMSVGPVALVSIIVYTGLSKFAAPMSAEFIELAILTSMVAGAIQVLLSIFRMGFLVNFLSHPVISGFTSAAAFIIAVSQLKYLFGIEVEGGSSLVATVYQLVSNISEIHWLTFFIGLGGLMIIMLFKTISKNIPGALIAVVAGTVLVSSMNWGTSTAILKEVPGGLPSFGFPALSIANIIKVAPLAFVVCLISFIESLAIAKTLAGRNDNYPISANSELLGLGLAKILGAFFQSIPNSGSFSRSAINEQAGAKTGISSIFGAIFIALALLFFTPLFYYLPKAILAAIVLAAVVGLVDIDGAKSLWKTDRKDFIIMMATFVLTIVLGIQLGVFVGIALSLAFILYKVSRPHYAVLGKLPEMGVYRNVDRFSEAETKQGHLIFRYDDDIFFANAEHFYDSVIKEVGDGAHIDTLILDASPIGGIDSTGVNQLVLLKKALDKKNIQFLISGMKGPVRDVFNRHELEVYFPQENVFINIEAAIKGQHYSKDSTLRSKLPVL